ncbi:T6SS phospholipase effector Tle1-like catalytic domain-containing protein [Snodgrassella alvi]|uniref:Uncharacterized protein n=1 Tax=Snodgrassella alvi TaxID=1196083 RepID=A0A2N9Y086_9NEIS|nr:DUF2235 domain-containing protein [Snodgrassella alvi]PIT58166.1 hypothetical protein BHC49_02530 [Snodgrassella alvi]
MAEQDDNNKQAVPPAAADKPAADTKPGAPAGKPAARPKSSPNNPHNHTISLDGITAGHKVEQNDYGIYDNAQAADAANHPPAANPQKTDSAKKKPAPPAAKQPGKPSAGQQPGKNTPPTMPDLPAPPTIATLETKLKELAAPYMPAIKPIEFQWPGILKPDEFPTAAGGRLPASISSIHDNRKDNHFIDRTKAKPCQKILKISFFFDGTNNHEKADSVVSGATPPTAEQLDPLQHAAAQQAKLIPAYTYPRTTNVARLFHACMGAGGRPGDNNRDDEMIKNGWFKHYIQGVGTRFEEIGDDNPKMLGEALAKYGQARINWGLTRICDSLGICKIFNEKDLPLATAQKMVKGMDCRIGRKVQLDSFLNTLQRPDSTPLPKAIKLYVVGFSRGAAEARTFINWLLDYLLDRDENAAARAQLEQLQAQQAQERINQRQDNRAAAAAAAEAAAAAKQDAPDKDKDKAPAAAALASPVNSAADKAAIQRVQAQAAAMRSTAPKTAPKGKDATAPAGEQAYQGIELKLLGIPIYIEMCGLFDTVATVGMSPLVAMVTGHCSWAHRTMSLQRAGSAGFVKNCYQFVSAHEQRKSFSVDSICVDGGYPKGNFKEYVYPGVHSDIGGGYPPGEQFKSNYGMGHVLAQITLHDMYARCWQHGMPLQVFAKHPQLAKDMQKHPRFQLKNYEIMDIITIKEFDTQPEMVQLFNGWLKTLETTNISTALQKQIHHFTAYRILRWVRSGIAGYASYLGLPLTADGSVGEKESKDTKKSRTKLIGQGRKEANEAGKGNLPDTRVVDNDELWQQAGLDGIPKAERSKFLDGIINKNYVAGNDGWDLIEGAKEFKADYLHEFHLENILSAGFLISTAFAGSMYMLNNDDEAAEYQDIHNNGDTLYFGADPAKLKTPEPPANPLPIPPMAKTFVEQQHPAGAAGNKERSQPWEFSAQEISDMWANADKGSLISGAMLNALRQRYQHLLGAEIAANTAKDIWQRLRQADMRDRVVLQQRLKIHAEKYSATYPHMVQIFDNQIHDSRAWFMHDSALSSREPFTSYFAHRLVFSGGFSNKPLSPVLLAERVVGIAGIARSAYMGVKYGNPAYILIGLNNPELFVTAADKAAWIMLTKDYEALAIDPDTGKILPNSENLEKLRQFSKDMQTALEQIKNEYAQQQPWTNQDFADKTLDQIIQNSDETIKNLNEIRELLLEQQRKLDQLASSGSQVQQQAQQLNKMLDKVSSNQQQLQAAVQQAKAGSIDKPQLQTALQQGMKIYTDPLANMPQTSLMQPPGLENISKDSLAAHLRQQLSQYQQNLSRSSQTSAALLESGAQEPQTLAQAFYHNSSGDIYDQAVEQISQSALNRLGLGQLEINQYLPENIASRSQPEISRLLQQLQTGDIPPQLQTISPQKLELIKKVLQSWLV